VTSSPDAALGQLSTIIAHQTFSAGKDAGIPLKCR